MEADAGKIEVVEPEGERSKERREKEIGKKRGKKKTKGRKNSRGKKNNGRIGNMG